jgi:DNA-binding transcriptional ArsR family regulator
MVVPDSMGRGYLFDSCDAAETVAYMTRTRWDGCNGISEFKESKASHRGSLSKLSQYFTRFLPRAIINFFRPRVDGRVLELAAELVKSEYCRIGDSCGINSRQECLELSLIQFSFRSKISSLERQIISILSDRELYGLEIRDALRATSRGLTKVNFGTLYPALRRLERLGLVKARWSQERLRQRGYARKRYYRLNLRAIRFQQRS